MLHSHHEVSPRIVSQKLADIVNLPKIVYVNKFDEENLKTFKKEFNEARDTGQEIIPVVIDSYGGALDSLTGMIDEIKAVDVPVATIATGKAMSCGSFLLAAGTPGYRFISPNARVLIHQISAGSWGKKEDIQADAAELERLDKLLWAYMDTWCNKPQGFFKKQMKDRLNADWYLSALDAFKYGLVDFVGLPKLKTTISVKTELLK
jgi:ATP-dependent Clp protease protease subunit